PMDRAAGSICGTIIIPYPPGVPCLYPGEIITGETVVKLRTFIEGNGVVLGLDKGMIPVLERT
ncbi:MAG TPA: arginine decarboxylase, partial [Clostridia bacterium]|nr:arginine decarboxylase [Clostridia bacterium]